ncbi:MAG: type IV toxin-antitoxin system AbiEi family antitoxin domain-containing protein [Proteobacteria bacterium]|nr:type IV toxin-antitoxin system AbiEi family antitoxin domain-containing protein [Pseudomonadota bacterium]
MNDLAGIGKLGRARLSKVLEGNPGTISAKDIAELLGLTSTEANRVLSRWCANGWLYRVKRGVYIPIPIDSTSSEILIEEPFVIAHSLYHPGYVAGFSAIKHWDLSEQIIETVYYFSTKQLKERNPVYGSTRFKIKTVKEDRLFGTKTIWYGSNKVKVSDPTKTVVDILDDPKLVGGMSVVCDIFQEYSETKHRDFKKLLDYVDRINNKTIFKRLGLIIDVRIDDIPIEFQNLNERISSGYSNFDPTTDGKFIVEKWKLKVPASWKKEYDRKK